MLLIRVILRVAPGWVVCLRRWSFPGVFACAALVVCVPTALGFSFVFGLLAFPLCGGHLLFFACRNEK